VWGVGVVGSGGEGGEWVWWGVWGDGWGDGRVIKSIDFTSVKSLNSVVTFIVI